MIHDIKKIVTFLSFYLKQIDTRKKILFPIIGILLASILYIPIPQLMGLSTNILSTKSNINKFIYYIILLIVLYIVRYFILVNSKSSLSKLEKKIISEIKIDMIKKYLNLPLSEIQKEAKGNVIGRFEETNQLSVIFSSGFIGTILNFFEFFFSLLIIIKINSIVFIYLLLISPIYYYLMKKLSSGISNVTTELFINSNIVTGKVFECVNGIEEIKKVNAKNFIINRIKKSNELFLKSAYEQNRKVHTFTEDIQILYNLINISILALCGFLVFYKDMEFAQYLILSGYILKILSFIQGASSLDIFIKPAAVAVDRIKEYLSFPNEDNESLLKIEKICNIDFENVSYNYSDTNKIILKNLNFKINKGDNLLIQGPIGSGKSTILKLMIGLYEPTNGEIYINGLPSKKINKECLREKIGIVSQDIILFNGTIADNIILDNKEITIPDIERIIDKLELRYLLDQFEDGLQTIISLNGQGISGGQTKIIALLRAICTPKDIIILDEATSNLDHCLENKIIKAFRENKITDTLIVISHENSWDYISKRILM